MNVSSSVSASSLVVIAPVPVDEPARIVMDGSEPKSSASAVPAVSVSGIVTSAASVSDSRAVTVTEEPSSTGFGDAESRTLGDAGGGGVVPPSSSSNAQVHRAVTSWSCFNLNSNPAKPE